ncbi:MAG: potassium channel family protein [Candidatus Hydrothermarchaeaceae archaeon]
MVYFEIPIYRRIVKVLFLVLAIVVLGLSGFVFIEGMGAAEAFYLTVATVTTVGYGDLVPVTEEGRLFASFLMIFGVGIVLYASWNIIGLLVEEEISDILGMARMQKRIKGMKGHVVVCGFGAVGGRAVEVLRGAGVKDIVVVEKDPDVAEEVAGMGIPVVKGDATVESALVQANVGSALAFLAALNDDAQNLLAAMTAKDLNEGISIIARAKMPETRKKLERIGVNRVVSPELTGGTKMARAILHPEVADFMHMLIEDTGIEIGVEEVRVLLGDRFEGKTIGESEIRSKTGVTVMGIKKDEKLKIHPRSDTKIEQGDILIILGERGQLDKFNKEFKK